MTYPVDAELDYLGKMIAKCRSDWPKDKRLGTVQAQLKSWNDGNGQPARTAPADPKADR